MPKTIYHRNYFIYKATEKLTGLIYIGQTTDSIEQRFYGHLAENITDFDQAYTNPDDFDVEILLEMKSVEHDPDNRLAPARIELDNHEKRFIAENNATDPTIGYNRTQGGEGFGTTSASALAKEERMRKKWEASYGKPWISKHDENGKSRYEWNKHSRLKSSAWLCDEWLEHDYGWQRFYWECAVNIPEEWLDNQGVSIVPVDKTKPLGKDNYKIQRPDRYEAVVEGRAKSRKDKKAKFKEEMGFEYYTKREAKATWDHLTNCVIPKFGHFCPPEWVTGENRLSYFIAAMGLKPGEAFEYILEYEDGKFFWKKYNKALNFTGQNTSQNSRKIQTGDQMMQVPALVKSI